MAQQVKLWLCKSDHPSSINSLAHVKVEGKEQVKQSRPLASMFVPWQAPPLDKYVNSF